MLALLCIQFKFENALDTIGRIFFVVSSILFVFATVLLALRTNDDRMRYQVFDKLVSELPVPVVSAPWQWLATLLVARRSRRWDCYRLVDTRRRRR